MSSICRMALASVALGGLALACVPVSGARSLSAKVARRQSVSDTAYLHKTQVEGAIVFEQGNATGALPGVMRARLDTNGFHASFTLQTRGGTLKGHGSATLCEKTCSGHYESFRGTLVIDGGTGRFAHAQGRGGLYGVFNRATYGLEVQTTGTLSY